jgi:adenylyltransferase/sulfurtransferase
MAQVGASLNVLPKDQPIVVHCKMGGRSAQITAQLRAKGYDARNLTGGILAWISRIDSSLNSY